VGRIWLRQLVEHRRQILCAIRGDANAESDSNYYSDANGHTNSKSYPYA
jgi:hypothetical protein